MVKQYPYKIFYKNLSNPSSQNGDGDFVHVGATWVDAGKCRDEANTGKSMINLLDGKAYIFDSIILMPPKGVSLIHGMEIEVREGNQIRLTGKIQRFSRDKFHSRAWV